MQSTAEDLQQEQTNSVADSRLVEEIRRGDQDAFGLLVQRYEKRLYRVIFRFVRNEALTEDLVQETFIRVYENLNKFDTSRRFGPWLFQVGVNLSLDYLRKQKRRGWTNLFSDVCPDNTMNPGTSDPRLHQDLTEEVQKVLQHLPEKYRIILVLRDLEYFSTAEIAAIVKRKESTVRWRLAEARNQFKHIWNKRHGSDMGETIDEVALNASSFSKSQ